jgi:hypothetical protein
MKSLIVVIYLFLLVNICNVLHSQNVENKNTFIEEWIFPNIPDSLIKPLTLETGIKNTCSLLLLDSIRAFGNIRGMSCDENDNLYVWDDGYLALWKFSCHGEKLWRKKFEKGNNDGEFNNVGPAFAVSRKGKICLGDKGNKTITILASNGNFIKRFKVDMWPATITFGKDESIYIAGFPMSYQGNLVQHYDIDGIFINSFCERKNMTREVMFSGNSGRLSTDEEGNIYYAYFYPYQIEKYSKTGKLLNIIESNEDEFIAPRMENGMIASPSGLKGLINIPKNYLAVVVYENINSGNWRIDFYHSDKIIKKLFSDKVLPINFSYRYSAVDSKGNLYFDLFAKPEPVIIKYKIDYSIL